MRPHLLTCSPRHVARSAGVGLLLGLALMLAGPAHLAAQTPPEQPERDEEASREPLRLAVLNVSKQGGSQAEAELLEVLSGNDAIALIEGADVRAVMKEFAVTDEVLRQSELREKFRNRLFRLVTANRIEGLLAIDVYNKGRTVQIVVIGPEGGELHDVRRTIKRGRLDQEGALEMLQEVFPALAPEVQAYRASERERVLNESALVPDAQASQTIQEQGDEAAAVTLSEQPGERRGGHFERGIDLSLGYFYGHRDLLLSETDNNNPDRITHTTAMSGVGAQLDATALSWGEGGARALALRGAFAIGFFDTTFTERDEQLGEVRVNYASQSFDVAGDLVLRRQVGARAHLGAFAGAQHVTVKISQTSRLTEDARTYNNSRYTGTGYFALRLGAEVALRLNPRTSAELYGGALPLLNANVSQALGESQATLGALAGARLKVNLTENFYAQGVYAFSLFRPSFPDPPGTLPGGGTVNVDSAARGRDLMHSAQLLVGLSF